MRVGKDTHHPLLRRVGLGLVSFQQLDERMEILVGAWGPLPGDRQTVARGEIWCLLVCLQRVSGHCVYTTDNDAVSLGWHQGKWRDPSGPDADLWWRIGRVLQERGSSLSCSVLFVHSHLEGEDIVRGVAPRHLVHGNTIVDSFAAVGADVARLAETERARVHNIERQAFAVRMRILQSTLEAIQAEERVLMEEGGSRRQKQSNSDVVRPPAASVCGFFGTNHCLKENTKSCSRCQGFSSKVRRTDWLSTNCFSPINVDGTQYRPPPGHRVHLGGGFAHESHALNYHASLDLWFCTRCGCYASQQLCSLGTECAGVVTGNRKDYVGRISRGLWPKVLSRAELASGKRQGR